MDGKNLPSGNFERKMVESYQGITLEHGSQISHQLLKNREIQLTTLFDSTTCPRNYSIFSPRRWLVSCTSTFKFRLRHLRHRIYASLLETD